MQEDLSLEGQKINHCQDDSDCSAFCLSACPGSFAVYNQKMESYNKFQDLYHQYEEEKYQSEYEDRPICGVDFCQEFIIRNEMKLSCQQNFCQPQDGSFKNNCANCY